MYKAWLAFICFNLACLHNSWGQQVEIVGSSLFADCIGKNKLSDTLLNQCILELRNAGFLEANIDQKIIEKESIKLLVHQGEQYQVTKWRHVVDSNSIYGPTKIDELPTIKKVDDIVPLANEYIEAGLNSGYAFSRIQFDSISIDDQSLSGRVRSWSGPLIQYGGIRFFDESTEPPVSVNFLQRFLDIAPQSIFDYAQFEKIEQRLSALRFIDLRSDPLIVFESGLAYVYLNAKARQTSRFDFLLGFLPNSEANNGQLLLTGDITLSLENALRKGEKLFFNFERLQPQSTEVSAAASYPYLFESPFGIFGEFNLYRQQDDWLRVNYELGGNYTFSGSSSISLFYEGGQAQILGFDTSQIEQTLRLPEVLDANRNGFGAKLLIDKRDDAFNTRKGWELSIKGSAAIRTVSVPGGIRDIDISLQEQADSISTQSGQFRAELSVANYIPLGFRSILVQKFDGAIIGGGQQALRNELHRIGGNRLLRGFDEQTIDADQYGVFTLEYRLLIGNGSYIFAFGDQGFLNDPYNTFSRFDNPTGFGAGLRLATNNGGLSLTYAYGQRKIAPLDLQRAKIHIGYETRF